MTKQIVFRAKRVDSGEWVSGYYWRSYSEEHINGKVTKKYIHKIKRDEDNFNNDWIVVDGDTVEWG